MPARGESSASAGAVALARSNARPFGAEEAPKGRCVFRGEYPFPLAIGERWWSQSSGFNGGKDSLEVTET
jgi:hypothetical protein